jgi:enamine deaminase RidA (YjgF/YER057c/UK114 family)
MRGQVSYLNPDGLHRNPAFSQVVVAGGGVRTVYVGGQNAVHPGGVIVGPGGIGVQAAQVARNLRVARAAGAFREVLGDFSRPPVITVLFVAALANPAFLLEVDGIAVVPEETS